MGYGESLSALIENESLEFPSLEDLKRDLQNGIENDGEFL